MLSNSLAIELTIYEVYNFNLFSVESENLNQYFNMNEYPPKHVQSTTTRNFLDIIFTP